MSAAAKERKAKRAPVLLRKPPAKDILIFYSNEKNFSQDQQVK